MNRLHQNTVQWNTVINEAPHNERLLVAISMMSGDHFVQIASFERGKWWGEVESDGWEQELHKVCAWALLPEYNGPPMI